MRLISLYLLIFGSVLLSFGQKQTKVFFDEDWSPCKEEFASYYRLVRKSKEGYLAKDYYMNGKVQMTGAFKDKKCTIYTGHFEWFDSTGNVNQVRNYFNNNLVGDYIDYYPTGAIMIKSTYLNGVREGVYEEFYPNGDLKARANFAKGMLYGPAVRYFQDKSEALILDIDSIGNGHFVSFYKNGNKRILGELKNGYQIREWQYYDMYENITKVETKNTETDLRKSQADFKGLKPNEPLNPKTKELNYLFFSRYNFDYDPIEGIIEFPDVEAEFIGGFEAMTRYIQRTLNYPADAIRRKKQGKVYVHFIVEKDGSISNVKAIKGPAILKAESIRVVKSMPKWKPGEVKGKAVRTLYRLPINYTLN